MSRPRLRARLALLHAGLSFLCGLVLLAFVDLPLLAVGNTRPASGGPSVPSSGNVGDVLRYSALALVVIAVLSVVLGWVIAGRALRPISLLTASARTMSADTLNDRPRVTAAYKEFTELADTLDGLMHRLHESFTVQRQFVANASHELRTPLTVQRTLLQLTLADPDATAVSLRAACEEMVVLGRRQEDLIDALLTLARGYRGVEDWECVDLAEVVRAVPGHDGSALRPAPVTGDPRLIASLVTNLVDNAVRHNVPGGTVEIATAPPGRLTVSNTGVVIPPTEINRLFQPFQRLGTDRTDDTDGHGLGLAIVAAIAHAHHASITARPRPGGGLHITVDFPGRM